MNVTNAEVNDDILHFLFEDPKNQGIFGMVFPLVGCITYRNYSCFTWGTGIFFGLSDTGSKHDVTNYVLTY